MSNTNVAKVYVRGSVCRHNELVGLLKQFGAKNCFGCRCGDPSSLYFINEQGEIDYALEGSKEYFILLNSDWKELKLKEPRKTRYFLVTVKEGENDCSDCNLKDHCDDKLKSKCNLCNLLSSLSGCKNLDGSTAVVTDFTDNPRPPVADKYWPIGFDED